MSDEREQLQTIKDLIGQQRYDEARTMLQAMSGNPTADKWLAQLNERYPVQATEGGAAPTAASPAVDEEAILEQAKTFIDSQQYQQAYSTLAQIPNHPTAQKWMDRIIEIDPFVDTGDGGGDSSPRGARAGLMGGGGAAKAPVNVEATSVLMVPQVTAFVRPLFSRAPAAAIIIGVSTILFGISWFLTAVIGDDEFVTALINTLLVGGSMYAMMYLLSIRYKTLNFQRVLVFIAGWAVFNFIFNMIEDVSVLLLFIFMLGAGGLMAFAFSSRNPLGKDKPESKPSLSDSWTVMSFIVYSLIVVLPITFLAFRVIAALSSMFSGGSDSDINLHTLIFGLIQGAMLSAYLYFMLDENMADEDKLQS